MSDLAALLHLDPRGGEGARAGRGRAGSHRASAGGAQCRARESTGLISPGKEPDIVPPDYKRDWKTEQRFLQAGTGTSWALAGLGTIGMAVPLAMLNRCNNASDAGAMVDCSQERRTAGIMAPILGVLTVAAIVPAVMFTRRLVKHDNKKPGKQRTAFGVNAGGLQLQF
ncbi:hypothetical protein [Nannocystis pusilla]|uniref:hypothetical protein n=1 Tax=Nannocystis pusilla TaxID=889268 RepID=UPI003B81A7A7